MAGGLGIRELKNFLKINNESDWNKWEGWKNRSHIHVYLDELLSEFLPYAKKKSEDENNGYY